MEFAGAYSKQKLQAFHDGTKKTPTNSGNELSPTDLAILRHVSLYRLTFTYPVMQLFFPEVNFTNREAALSRAGDALAALAKLGYLTSKENDTPLGFNRNHKYFILTGQGAKLIEAPTSRTKSPNEPATDLAVLWLCSMGKKRFHRVDRQDLLPIVGDDAPRYSVRHVISQEEFGPVIYRVYPATSSKPANVVEYAKKILLKTRKKEALLPIVEVGDYGFAILAPTEDHRLGIQNELRKPDGKLPPLNRQARFTVRLGPTPQTLNQAIEGLKAKTLPIDHA